jgi:excisionase family DNA binding protein
MIMEPVAITIDEAAKAGGPRRAKLYEEIKSGRLRAVKIGRSTRILMSDFRAYIASLPTILPSAEVRRDEVGEDAPRKRRRRRRKA